MNVKTLNIQQLQDMYLDRINNFLTNEKFAEHYGLSEKQAALIIAGGAEVHEIFVKIYKRIQTCNIENNC